MVFHQFMSAMEPRIYVPVSEYSITESDFDITL